MLRLLELLIYGHIHVWETIEASNLSNSYGDTGSRHILRCTNCGNIKKVDLI